MSSKKQLTILISAFVTVLLFIAAVNYWFDPFGVFNKKQGWFSYQMTRNPRTAKISYLNHHHANYDSFILGSSGASGLVSASFDDGKYYNLFFYGADMKDIKQTAHYIMDHYEVKQVILPITFSFAENYDAGNENLSYVMKPEVTGENPLAFYPQYLFSSLSYAYEMWQSQNKDSYLPKPFDVFVPESGNYDKRVRRVEYLGSLEEYLAKYPEFQHNRAKIAMPYMDAFFGDLEEVLNRFRD
ncbi:MAG: hypothetical protein Q4A52_07090, partial [Bacillota bacterium]|nr:hypothetical protein [Bacillota bacterium]